MKLVFATRFPLSKKREPSGIAAIANYLSAHGTVHARVAQMLASSHFFDACHAAPCPPSSGSLFVLRFIIGGTILPLLTCHLQLNENRTRMLKKYLALSASTAVSNVAQYKFFDIKKMD